MIVLFTDFGQQGPYVGQMHLAIRRRLADCPIIDLMHDAPMQDAKRSAYLLAALARHWSALPAVFVAVVDPGVGGNRPAMTVQTQDQIFVGPGNGLFEIVIRQSPGAEWAEADWRPDGLSDSFHGRDLFAPLAAKLWQRHDPRTALSCPASLRVSDWPDQLADVIYIDAFGNAMTGLLGDDHGESAVFLCGGREIGFARTFSNVPAGHAFWYRNSIGLVEIAVNCGSAADVMGLQIGSRVTAGEPEP